MAECKECGIEMGFMDRQNARSYDGQCRACTEKERVKQKLISQGVPLVLSDKSAQASEA